LLSRAFVTLADTMVDDYDVIELLCQLADFCVTLLPAEAAGILLGDARRELRAVAASDEAAHVMELLQLQSDQGPCLDCFQSGAPVSVADLVQAAQRWPAFIAAVRQRGHYRSIHALPLRLRGHAIGALNLFHRRPGPMAEADLSLAQAMADVATIGILQQRAIRRGEILNEQLQTALNSRVTIEQAKGVLAQHSGLGPDAAFERLRAYARAHNLRLVEVGRDLIDRSLDAAEVVTQRPTRSHPN
jgi:GAF domain-containing protein